MTIFFHHVLLSLSQSCFQYCPMKIQSCFCPFSLYVWSSFCTLLETGLDTDRDTQRQRQTDSCRGDHLCLVGKPYSTNNLQSVFFDKTSLLLPNCACKTMSSLGAAEVYEWRDFCVTLLTFLPRISGCKRILQGMLTEKSFISTIVYDNSLAAERALELCFLPFLFFFPALLDNGLSKNDAIHLFTILKATQLCLCKKM